MMRRFSVFASVLLIVAPQWAQADARVESNIVFGMYSGLALLMDVHYPERPNGYGVVHVSGSGWTRPLAYSAAPLTQNNDVEVEIPPLLKAGYTVFTVNHRATPRFQYPAPVEDVQRAVRFIRYHASEYEIDPDNIGAMGGSSGGHLVSMLGVLDGAGDAADPDPINRVSAKVQCVVGRAVPASFPEIETTRGAGASTLLLGASYPRNANTNANTEEAKRYIAASPVTYVSSDDPPFLLLHGDADPVIPFQQSGLFADALRGAGVKAEVLPIPGGGHGHFAGAENPPDWKGAMVRWFDQNLIRDE
jgi:acetyl esterase/lipase